MTLAKCRECGADVSDEAKSCPKCGISKPVKKTSIFIKIVGVIFGIAILVNVINATSGGGSHHQESNTATKPNLHPKDEALSLVKLEKWGWHKGGFDNVMMLNGKIKNEGSRDVKDIEIECSHSSNSGTRIDSNTKIVYEIVKAGKTLNIKEFNMGFVHSQATSSSCRITDLVLL